MKVQVKEVEITKEEKTNYKLDQNAGTKPNNNNSNKEKNEQITP